MAEAETMVFVIDDDAGMREALQSLIRSVGLRVQTFASAREFLTSHPPEAPAGLVLDMRLPGLSGLDLQRELAAAAIHLPIIFITGHGDIPMTVQAMQAGAVEFLTKPFRDQDLRDVISLATEHDRQRRVPRADVHVLRCRTTCAARRVPAISGTAEHTTFADGYSAVNLSAASAGLPTVCAVAPAFVMCSSQLSLRGRSGLGKFPESSRHP